MLRNRLVWTLWLVSQVAVAQSGRATEEEWKKWVAQGAKYQGRDDIPTWERAVAAAKFLPEGDWRRLMAINRRLDSCWLGRWDSACGDEKARQETLKLAKAWFASTKQDGPEVEAELRKLAGTLRVHKEYNDSLNVWHRVLEIREGKDGDNSSSVAACYVDIARTYQAKGDNEQAKRTFDNAVNGQLARKVPPSEGRFDFLLKAAAFADEVKGRWRQAELLESAREEAGRLYPRRNPDRGQHLMSVFNQADGQLRQDLRKELRGLAKEAFGADGEARLDFLTELGRIDEDADEYKEAAESYRLAVEAMEETEVDEERRGEILATLAGCYIGLKEYSKAGSTFELAAAEVEKNKARRGVWSRYLLKAAQNWHEAKDVTASERCFRKSLDVARTENTLLLAEVATDLGRKYLEQRQPEPAIEKLEIAAAIYEADGKFRAQRILVLTNLGKAYQAAGRLPEANAANSQVLKLSLETVNEALSSSPKAALSGAAAIFAGVGLLVLGVPLLVFILAARHVDKNLAKLYAPKPVEPPPTEAPTPTPPPTPPTLPLPVSTWALYRPPGALPESLPAPAIAQPPLAALPVVNTGPPPGVPFLYHGEALDLFAMRVYNILLTIATLGIYSFWAKARVRRYLCSQAEFLGDRFHFHGTGGELFRGWLRGAPFLAFILFFPNVLPLFWHEIQSYAVAQFAALGALLILWPIARAGAFRYRMNRMSWRGIRFRFAGSTPQYFWLSILGYLGAVPTLGVYLMKLAMDQRRFLFSQLSIGDRPFAFSGRSRHLLLPWLATLPLLVCSYGLIWPWWSALRSRYYWAHTTLGDARFRCTVTGGGLLVLWLTNFLILVGTLGLGGSWTSMRSIRYWSQQLELVGDIQAHTLHRAESDAKATGESFADFLGFDFGF